MRKLRYDRLESAALPSGVTVVLDGSAWRGFIKFGHGQEPDRSAPARITACGCGQPVAFWDSGPCALLQARQGYSGTGRHCRRERTARTFRRKPLQNDAVLPANDILIVVILAGGQLITGADFVSDIL